MAPVMVPHDGAANGSHFGFGAASAGVLLLMVATALCMWWHRRRRSAPEETADKEQLRKDLLHAHDSVVVAKKRITGEEVKTAASIPAIYDTSDNGGNCGNSSDGAAGADRVPMVAFFDLPEEEQKRLRAGNINDSVLIMRNKRATSGAGSSPAKGGEAAVEYYQQQLVQLRSSRDGSSNTSSSSGGGAEGATRMPGQLRGRSSDGSESGKRVQFGAAQVMAVSSAAGGASSAAGDASVAGTAVAAGVAAAAVPPALDCAQPEHVAATDNVLLPGGVGGDSISIDTSELGAGQRHSRGDDTARVKGAQLSGSAS